MLANVQGLRNAFDMMPVFSNGRAAGKASHSRGGARVVVSGSKLRRGGGSVVKSES